MKPQILIADSGSTKADWRLIESNGTVKSYTTFGLNPYLQSDEELYAEIQQGVAEKIGDVVSDIYFYGAGVATEDKADLLVRTLRKAFPGAKKAGAYSDLFGAARALCGREPGIVCILGTGSNSCFYDGKILVDNVPPCGYILGDEGSGAVLGRKLLSAFLKRGLSPTLNEKLVEKYRLTKEIILERVYKKPFPNRYLAGFTIFLKEYIEEPSIMQLVQNSFGEFLDNNVCRYENHRSFPVHFTGSIAYHFQDLLRIALEKRGLKLGKILQAPANDLAEFHANYTD